MDQLNERITGILYKVIGGRDLTFEEQDLLDEWLSQSIANRDLFEEITDPTSLEEGIQAMSEAHAHKHATWAKIQQGLKQHPRGAGSIVSFFRSYGKYAAAAFILILAGVYFLFIRPSSNTTTPGNSNNSITASQQTDIDPGGDKAILQLSDGSQIVLDNSANGKLVQQKNTQLSNGLVSYTLGSGSDQLQVAYNTMITPRTGKYEIKLTDGTHIWINNESKLRYPTAFIGGERKIELLEGEIYLEVAKDAKHPFKVVKGNMEVEVLGTHFNINAYNNEASIKTTLLEGKVRVTVDNNQKILQPGEQADLNKQGDLKVIADVDLDQTVAWKNGEFAFVNADMETIMRTAARWYDFETVFVDKIPGGFKAPISRDVPLSKLLHLLELTNKVHFEIEGKTVRVISGAKK